MLKYSLHQKIKVSKIINGEKFNSLIMSDVDNTLIITRPKIEINSHNIKFMDYLYPKNNIYITYEYEGIEYAFRTYVLKTSYTPFPYIILKYPEENNIKINKIRKYERFQCILPIHINHMEKEFEISYKNTYVIDASMTGLGIIAQDNIPEKFLATFILNSNKVVLLCEQKVYKPFHFNNYHLFGCKIVKIKNEKAYSDYIDTLKTIRAK